MLNKLSFISNTNRGLSYQCNEDSLGHIQTPHGDLFIVCDGVGGLPGGELASQTAVKNIKQYFQSNNTQPYNNLKNSIQYAHSKIKSISKTPIGTTIVMLYYTIDKTYCAWVGDSRLYIFRKNSLEWFTRDHNVLHDILNRGLGKGSHFMNPNAITRYLGKQAPLEIDICELSVLKNDYILLCTDGLSNFIMEPDLINIIFFFF